MLVGGFWPDNAAANSPLSVIPCGPLSTGIGAGDCGGSGASLENNLSISDIDVVALVGRGGPPGLDECMAETLALVTSAALDKGGKMYGRREYLLVYVPGKNRWRS